MATMDCFYVLLVNNEINCVVSTRHDSKARCNTETSSEMLLICALKQITDTG